MWETKYALTLPKNLGVGVDFWPCRAVKAISSLGIRHKQKIDANSRLIIF